VTPLDDSIPVRDRLLLAGARLMDAAGGPDVSTRAVCELAGVQPPTLYHHFGSREGLLSAVVSHGLRRFLAEQLADADPGGLDAIEQIRQGWDFHVQFGLAHPAFYAHIYGHVQRGRQCGVVSDVEKMLLQALQPAAREGRLAVTPESAAAQILAASSGVVLALITDPSPQPDTSLSERVRDAVLASVTAPGGMSPAGGTGPNGPAEQSRPAPGAAAVALAAALEGDSPALSAAENALLRDWLTRIANHRPALG
jgi:AcrR family transcriptional regulator